MNVKARKRFFKDLASVKSREILDDIEFVYDFTRQCAKPEEIPGFKWMRGYYTHARIEVAPFRIGVEV